MSEFLGELLIEDTHLWGTMAEFQEALGSAQNITSSHPLRVGWRLGEGAWMEVASPSAPTQSQGCGWSVLFKATGAELQNTPESVVSPGNRWYLVGCNKSLVVGQLTKAENPNEPNQNCGNNGFEVTGWLLQEWWSNECGEGFYGGKELFVKTYAQAYYDPFHFGVVEEWKGQQVEGEYKDNVQTIGTDPGQSAVKEALELLLEKQFLMAIWAEWVLEGESGPNPLLLSPEEELGSWNPGDPSFPRCSQADPVDCATGNETLSQTDLTVGGRSPGIAIARVYNSLPTGSRDAMFGTGWSAPYNAYISSESVPVCVYRMLCSLDFEDIVHLSNGSAIRFYRSEAEGWVPSNPGTQAKLVSEAGVDLLTLPDQTVLTFNQEGWLEKETDRNGNSLAISRTGGQVTAVTDPSGRKVVFAYNSEGHVESITDPMGHVVKYTYESGQLASVTLPGESSPSWRYKYNAQRLLTSMTDGRGGETLTEYDSNGRVVSQTDPAGRNIGFEYTIGETKITNKSTGAVTNEFFSPADEPVEVIDGYGTASAITTEYTYDSAGHLASVTDGSKHTTKYEYDSTGDRTKMVDPNGYETKWTYDSTHDVETVTTPKGETTTIKRDSHGNAETVSRPAPGSTTQITTFKYDSHGDLESIEDSLKRIWKYEYDNAGDRTAEVDPEGDKRTWGYNEDSQEASTVSPRGNVIGGEPSKYTTTIERDARGRTLKVTDPLGHATKYTYDADSNLETVTDPNNHTTTYTYDADNERTKVKKANGIVTETGYDGAGQVTSQTDGNKHEVKYVRNILEQVTEMIDPLGRKTIKEYDAAGNLKKLTDAAARTTTYTYDPANRLTEISYSDGKTHAIKYEYDADGDRTSIVDGTGTSSYTYDQLDRLTEGKDGHGDKTGYEYDLANQQTKITYPNGNSVTQTYDKAGRLEKVTDWLEHTTRFSYDPDSNLVTSTFPTGTSNVDKYAYNEADQMSEVQMLKGTETLASLVYTRDNNGQVKTITSKGLPGEEKPGYEYDSNNRLTKAGANAYEYDSSDNPTKILGSTDTYDNADELKTGTSVTYTYDELGERTKRTPTSGPATTYAYDQAGNLIGITRPKEGSTAEIKDTYTYDGNGLRASQTISGTTSFLTWDLNDSLPLILNDTTNSYIYGPDGLPVEQINSKGEPTYLHHDQQGSTRMLTSASGTVLATATYDPYGNLTGNTGSGNTPFRYDGQYTSSDTGLIYMRARVYDPSTAQFLTVDPLETITEAPYTYASDNPLTYNDPTGLGEWEPWTESFWTEGNFISKSPLNPIPYYEEEISSYENGCGYFASVRHGLEGATAGAALVPEDWGPELFQKFANRFPKAAELLIRQQAKQQVTQPGNVFIVKSLVEKILHLFGV